MNEGTKELGASISSRRVLHMSAAVAPEVAGRRNFLTYKDFGLKEASNGLLRATLFAATAGMTKPTGWHYHTCQGNFITSSKDGPAWYSKTELSFACKLAMFCSSPAV